jgi:DNA-binding PadR family transcriptional regulator
VRAFGETSGYDLSKFADRSAGLIWAPARRHAYNVLPRLVEYGLASVRDVEQKSRPDKRVYRITAAGRRQLEGWLDEEDAPGTDQRVFLLKTFFGGFVAAGTAAARIRRYRDELRTLADMYWAIARQGKDDPAYRFPYLTLRHAIARVEASLRWADEALRDLDRNAETTRTALPSPPSMDR